MAGYRVHRPDRRDGEASTSSAYNTRSDFEDSERNFMLNQLRRANLRPPTYRSFEELETTMTAVNADNLPEGAVKILITEQGEGPLVPQNAIVSIQYAAYFENEMIPEYTTVVLGRNQQMQFRLGDGDLHLGVEAALKSVRGPRARFLALLEPIAQWGDGLLPQHFTPPPMLFNVWLLGVDTHCRVNLLSPLRRTPLEVLAAQEQVISMILQGKDLMAESDYLKAITIFQQALVLLSFIGPNSETRKEEINDLRLQLFFKLAVSYFLLHKPRHILRMLQHVSRLIDVRTSSKALFCYGRAYQMLGQTELAITYYKDALALEPENVAFRDILSELLIAQEASAANRQSTETIETVPTAANDSEPTVTSTSEMTDTATVPWPVELEATGSKNLESGEITYSRGKENKKLGATNDVVSDEITHLECKENKDLDPKDLDNTDTINSEKKEIQDLVPSGSNDLGLTEPTTEQTELPEEYPETGE